jgi:hypothetical protein
MTPEEIMRFVLPDVIDKIKNPEKRKADATDQLADVPDFYPNYRKVVTDYRNIRVHAVKHVYPYKLFADRSPNQSQEEWEYVRANFRKVTMPVFVDFINLIQRAFFDQNYQIDYSNQRKKDDEEIDKDSFEWYLKNEICEYDSIDAWLKALPSIKIIDAMGVIAVRPEIPKMKIVDDEEIVDETELPEPQPYYYSCESVLKYDEDHFYLIQTERKSQVKEGSRTEWSGLVFELYDKENIWFITQVGKKSDYKFEITLFFNHGFGYPPVKKLDGVSVIEEGKPYKQSPFLYAVDNLDLVLLNATNLQLACNNSVYPIKVMIGNKCTFSTPEGIRCSDGVILNPAKGERITCPGCGGSGLQQRTSPIGVYLVRPKGMGTEEESPQDAIRFVSPEVHSLEFLEKRINTDEKRARAILHLKTDQQSGTGENVVESASQAKSTTAFIKPISDQIFDVLEFTIDSMRKIRYGVDSDIPNPEIMRPNSFDLLTHQDYLNEISEAIKNKLPGVVINAAIDRYISSLYRNEKDKLAVYKLLRETDSLLMNTEDEVAAKLSMRTIQPWEEVLHNSSVILVNELQNEVQDFLNIPIETQKKLLIKKAQDKAGLLPQITGVPSADSIIAGGGGLAEGNQIDTPIDIEAEAKAKLKGSVGGVQGILEIQTQVAEGITTYDAGIAILDIIYGIDSVASKRILGNKAEIQKKLNDGNKLMSGKNI